MLNLISNRNSVISLGMGVCSQYTKSAFTSQGLESFQHRFWFGVLVLELSLQFTFFPKYPGLVKVITSYLLMKYTSSSIWSSPSLSSKGKWTSQTFFLSNLMFKYVCFHFLAHKPRTLFLKFFLLSRQWVFVIWSLFGIICHLFMSDVRNFFIQIWSPSLTSWYWKHTPKHALRKRGFDWFEVQVARFLL